MEVLRDLRARSWVKTTATDHLRSEKRTRQFIVRLRSESWDLSSQISSWLVSRCCTSQLSDRPLQFMKGRNPYVEAE